ncbi:MAG: helix-turn-helix transcriptional regulator [Actinomycetes bacterium]
MSAQKTERLLNLVICLLSTHQFLAKEQIRAAVPQYADCATDEAFDRMFERDKDEVREMGIPLVTGSNSAWFEDEVGYRVDRAAYALPEVAFEPDELAVLSLASRVWQQATLAGPASRALLKLKATGVEPDGASLAGVEPRVGTSEPAFEGLYAAVRDRRPVTFPYRAGRTGDVVERHLDPWGIVSWHGRWYVVGHDRDRAATRVFRLSRIAGPVEHVGTYGEVTVPDGIDIRTEVAVLAQEQPRGQATLRVRPGTGVGLRRRATDQRPGAAADDWDEVVVAFGDPESLAAELAGYGPDVLVTSPLSVREAVVRRLTAVLASAS